MRRAAGWILSALTLAGLATLPVLATEQIASKEGVKCTVCHEKRGRPEFSDKGKYYEYKRTLEGYDVIVRKFKKCTLCHVKEPGNSQLTHTGMELKTRDVTMDHLAGRCPATEPEKKAEQKD
jgi:hypothetical protein